MRVIIFSKPFGAIGATELADNLAGLGADGADLVVRDGQIVTPADPRGIGAVARALERNGLRLDVVTTDLVDGDGTAERIMAACAEANVPLVRSGFFRYDPARGYGAGLESARRGIAGLVRVAVVAWQPIIAGLRERGYPGPLSLHIHYPTPNLLAALRQDLTQLRGLLTGKRFQGWPRDDVTSERAH